MNNAAIAPYKSVVRLTEQEWRQVIDTNVTGTFLVTKAALALMLKQGGARQAGEGVIINVASMLGLEGYPGLAAYCASKFSVIGFTESLAPELRQTRIKVYTVLPGGVDTPMYHAINKMEARCTKTPYHPEKERTYLLSPRDVAQLIVDLALHHRLQSGRKVMIEKVGRRIITKSPIESS